MPLLTARRRSRRQASLRGCRRTVSTMPANKSRHPEEEYALLDPSPFQPLTPRRCPALAQGAADVPRNDVDRREPGKRTMTRRRSFDISASDASGNSSWPAAIDASVHRSRPTAWTACVRTIHSRARSTTTSPSTVKLADAAGATIGWRRRSSSPRRPSERQGLVRRQRSVSATSASRHQPGSAVHLRAGKFELALPFALHMPMERGLDDASTCSRKKLQLPRLRPASRSASARWLTSVRTGIVRLAKAR